MSRQLAERASLRAEAMTERPLSEAEFARVAAFARAEFGLALQVGKKDLVQNRLNRILRQFRCPDAGTFFDRVENDPHCEERAALVSALTTNVTNFFREPHHFRLFSELILKPRAEALARGQRLRVWSAGCSAGQEPCSIAMTILELFPPPARINARILATDIDGAIIERARLGHYPDEERQSIPEAYRSRMIADGLKGSFQIRRELREMISFGELNLVQPWPMRGPFDAIFCRNVAIYFDKPTQIRLWERFARMLVPGGMLFIGHSERVTGPAAEVLVSAGVTSYRLTERTRP